MKFSAKLRVAKIIEWATGYDKDNCAKWREDDQFGCIIGYDDLLNIEDEIRTAYELGVIDGRQYPHCPVDEVASLPESWTREDDRHALSNKLITNALKRGDISRPQIDWQCDKGICEYSDRKNGQCQCYNEENN